MKRLVKKAKIEKLTLLQMTEIITPILERVQSQDELWKWTFKFKGETTLINWGYFEYLNMKPDEVFKIEYDEEFEEYVGTDPHGSAIEMGSYKLCVESLVSTRNQW